MLLAFLRADDGPVFAFGLHVLGAADDAARVLSRTVEEQATVIATSEAARTLIDTAWYHHSAIKVVTTLRRQPSDITQCDTCVLLPAT